MTAIILHAGKGKSTKEWVAVRNWDKGLNAAGRLF